MLKMNGATRKIPFLLILLSLAISFNHVKGEVGHGEACDDSDEATRCTSGLTCIYQTCSCETGAGFEYDAAKAKCVAQIGGMCGSDGDCVDNGQCAELFCECQAGFLATKDRHCTKPYGADCTDSAECSKDRRMICTKDNKCGCEDEKTQVFEDIDIDDDDDDDSNNGPLRGGFCSSKVDQNCDPGVDAYGFPNGYSGSKCIRSAVCQRAENLTFSCACPEGATVTEEKTCSAGVSTISFVFSSGIYAFIGFFTLIMSKD